MLTAAEVKVITNRKDTCCDNYMQANSDRAALLRDRAELQSEIGYLKDELEKRDTQITKMHALFDKAGIPDATGQICNDRECQSKLYHRLHITLDQLTLLKEVRELE